MPLPPEICQLYRNFFNGNTWKEVCLERRTFDVANRSGYFVDCRRYLDFVPLSLTLDTVLRVACGLYRLDGGLQHRQGAYRPVLAAGKLIRSALFDPTMPTSPHEFY